MIWIVSILAAILAVVTVIVVLSYAFAWYEGANSRPALMAERFSPSRLWLAVRLVGMETLFLFLDVLLHPLGWLPPKERQPAENVATPIILLHGLFHNRACWLWTKYRLRRRGFRSIYTLNLPPWQDVETLTERVAKKVDELRHTLGIKKVCLVGHSMGGIIARNYLQIRGGEQKVERCILLAAPNGGSKLAPFALSPLGRLLIPGSEFLRRLALAPLPPETELRAICSRHDNMVLPWEYGRFEGAHNIELAGMGHVSLLYHPRAFKALCEALTEGVPS